MTPEGIEPPIFGSGIRRVTIAPWSHMHVSKKFRGSIVVSIPACHAGNPGSIPGLGAFFVLVFFFVSTHTKSILGRVVKALDLSPSGLSPRGFEPRRMHFFFLLGFFLKKKKKKKKERKKKE